jgi:dipeptidyl-peptidase-4
VGKDSVYTERYNGLPSLDDNLENYRKFNVTRSAVNFTTVDYLLVHGTGDDNVHFQNTAQLVEALTNAEVDYRVQFYTDKQHSLGGDVTHRHLYRLLTNFLKEKLSL